MARTAKPAPTKRGGRKGERTRARILAAAEKVFAEAGYSAARVADIAEAAKVAHGTFYTYFDSKRDIFKALADEVTDEIFAAVKGGPTLGRTPLERIHNANARYIDLYGKHAVMLGLIEQAATSDAEFLGTRLDLRRRFIARVERAISRMVENGEAPGIDGLDPHIIANALASMIDNFCYVWFVLKEPFEKDEAVQALDRIWANALGFERRDPA
jgi:AcrR family transcriptional regulator